MTRLQYIGPLAAVEIDLPTGTVRAPRRSPVTLPDAVAEELLQRDDFTRIGTDAVAFAFTPSETEPVPVSGTGRPSQLSTPQPSPEL